MMKQFYKSTLFLIAFASSYALYGQSPFGPNRQLITPQSQTQGKGTNPLKPTDKKTASAGFKATKSGTKVGQNNPTFTQNSVLQSTQTPTERTCFTVESEKIKEEKHPKRLSDQDFEEKLSKYMASHRLMADDEMVYIIPTIVHVVHHGEPLGVGSNISQEQVMSQFEVLNEDFRRLGAGYNEHPDGADINIEFVPVLVDPQGKPLEEPGIDRIFGYSAYYEYYNIESELKPYTIWNPNQYFNIWVVTFGGSFSNILGYAQFPSFSGLPGIPEDGSDFTDGVVIGHQFFGRTGSVQAPFDQGRTTTHEVGHWLGLRHIWGDGDCSVDDFCADTPNANGPNYSCEFRDSCPEPGDDMIENYMDYSTDGCMNVFTNDQRARIRTVMQMSPRRKSLVACQNPAVASIGTNISEEARTWFQYTAPEDQVVTVSSLELTEQDTKLSFYRECNTFLVNQSDNESNTLQSSLSIGLKTGETVKILWENEFIYEPFQWSLSTSAEAAGATCELASTAVEGNNTTTVAGLATHWFTYSPSIDNQKITIDGEGKAFNVYGNTCNQLGLLKSSDSTATIYDVDDDESIYIAFQTQGEDFDWSLSTEDLRSGESCNDAIVANIGENIIPYSAPYEYWYTYTMPVTGNLHLKSAEEGVSNVVSVYKNCEGTLISKAQGGTQIALNAGETVKILWDGVGSEDNFSWYLESFAFDNGQICDVAKPAQIGTNHTDGTPQWFTYTTTKFTNLKISSVGFTDVDTHVLVKRECDGPVLFDNDNYNTATEFASQSELILYGLNQGEKLYILWSEKWAYEGFDWSLEEMTPVQGDNCPTAKNAVIGTNTVDFDENHSYYGEIFWTKFTVPATAAGKKIVAFSDIDIEGAIYATDGCESFQFIDGNVGKLEAFNLPAGLDILIIWDAADLSQDFTWELSIQNVVAGDFCSLPKDAVLGENTAPFAPIWYEYTMSQDANLKVSSVGLTDFRTIVYVLNGCENENILYTNDMPDQLLPGEAFVVGLKQGEKIYIYWPNEYPYSEFTWSLEEVPLEQGDLCSDPIEASYGLNYSDYATKWFNYTVQESGDLKISSLGLTRTNTLLKVYDACDGNLLAESNDTFVLSDFFVYYQSEVVLDGLEVGQNLQIKWAGDYSYAPFYWMITNNEPLTGDTCEDPLTAIEGVNKAMKASPSWFSFTMPETTSLTLSSLGFTGENTKVEVYDACNGNLIGMNDDIYDSQSRLYLDEVAEGQELLIYWSITTPPTLLNFEWELIVGEPETGTFCQFADEAQVGTNTTPDFTIDNAENYGRRYWFSFTMPEDGKKLVITHNSGEIVEVWNQCLVEGFDYDALLAGSNLNEIEVFGLNAGDQVYIDFMNIDGGGAATGFDWQLTISDLGEGDDCTLAMDAFPGINTTKYTATWYSYTMPVSGDIRLSAVGYTYADTYLEVYDACGDELIAENDNVNNDWFPYQSELLLENVEAGETIYIHWYLLQDKYRQNFDWSLTIEGVENNAPVLEDITFKIPTPFVEGKLLGTLEAEDADGDDLYYRIVSGNEDGAFALDGLTGELSIADSTKIPAIGSELELVVSVTDQIESNQAIVHFDVIMATPDQVASSISAFPNPASDKLYLQLPSEITVYQSYIIDLSGSLVKTNRTQDREISLSELKQGIYILKMVTDRGQFTYKVSVIK